MPLVGIYNFSYSKRNRAWKTRIHIYKYCLFLRSKTSLSRFFAVSLLRLPLVDSPAVEKASSIGADEPGIVNRSRATVDKRG